jgi:hypothetical protein
MRKADLSGSAEQIARAVFEGARACVLLGEASLTARTLDALLASFCGTSIEFLRIPEPSNTGRLRGAVEWLEKSTSAQTIRQAGTTRTVLAVQFAERLTGESLLLLNSVAERSRAQVPAVQMLLVGGTELLARLQAPGLEALRSETSIMVEVHESQALDGIGHQRPVVTELAVGWSRRSQPTTTAARPILLARGSFLVCALGIVALSIIGVGRIRLSGPEQTSKQPALSGTHVESSAQRGSATGVATLEPDQVRKLARPSTSPPPLIKGGSVEMEAQPPGPHRREAASVLDPRQLTRPAPILRATGSNLSFRGPVYNETMGQGGQMALVISKQNGSGAFSARFNAWGGLIGSGELSGHLSADGRIVASGQLMMGRNLFLCELVGTIQGDQLAGSATFVRAGTGHTARSHFTLSKS